MAAGRWTRPRRRWPTGTAQAGETLPLYVGVNLSAIQVARDDIAEVVESALKSSGLTGDRLTLELTESSIVQDPARATRVFEALKALDATVAMDDFGTGYSSLAYLQRLPIDVLKIDQSFVSGMMVDPDAWRSSARCSASPKRSACRPPPKASRRSSWRRRWRRSAARRARAIISPSRSKPTPRSNIGTLAPPRSIQEVGVTRRAGASASAALKVLLMLLTSCGCANVGRVNADAQHAGSAHGAVPRRANDEARRQPAFGSPR